jgi:cytidylate kinase
MIVTIDGPSGTGKTSVARSVALRLKFLYFDTGAMYRALTWLVMERGIDIQDAAAVQRCLEEFDYHIVEKDGEKRYFVGQKDVTEEIRSRAVTQFVSSVSALAKVRSSLLGVQRQFAQTQDVVFEGRDLGTVVFPNAEVKIFVNADPKVRAERRSLEILAKNPESGLTHEQILADIVHRDAYDSMREIAPLRCPSDAYIIDTTHLSIDQVVMRIVDYCFEKLPHL